jgi:hypothetical protein
VLTEDNARVLFCREAFNRLGEVSAKGQRSPPTAPSRPTPATSLYATPYAWFPRPLGECVDRCGYCGAPTVFGRAKTAQWWKRGGINQHLNARRKRASGTMVMFLVFAKCTVESSIRQTTPQ